MFSITKKHRFPAKVPSLPANRSTSTSTFPVPIDSCSSPPSDHQTLCLFLADGLIKRRLLSAARSVVERIIQRSSLPDAVSVVDFAASRGLFSDPKSYSSLLHTLLMSGQLHRVERIYTACRGIDSEPSVLNCMIICYSRLGELDLAMTHLIEIVKMGSLPSRPAYDTLVRALCIEERFLEVVEMFFQMVDSGILPGLSSFNLLVDRLASNGYLDEAVGVFRVMMESGIPPTIRLFKSLVYSFCKRRRVEEAECLCSEMESHGLVDLMVRNQIEPDLFTYGSLISGICRNISCKRRQGPLLATKTEKARQVLFSLLPQKTLTPAKLNQRISCSSDDEKIELALKLMREIVETGLMPDLHIYNGMINGFCRAKMMQDAYDLKDLMMEAGVAPNQVTYTILINGHSRFGEIDQATELFNEMNAKGCAPDKSTYNTLIKGFCMAGRVIDALSLARTMHKRGFIPNNNSYNKLVECLYRSHSSDLAMKLS